MRPVQPRARESSPARRPAARRFGWGTAAVVAALALALGWYALRKHDADADLRASRVPETAGSVAASASGPSPQGGPQKSQDPAITSKVNRGSELLKQGRVEEAIDLWNEALRLDPADEDIHYNLGLALSRQGKNDEAIQQYEAALRIFPDYVEAHNNLGNLLSKLGRAQEAIPHFEKAIEIMPDYASAENNLGTALQRAGRGEEALEHFQKAARLNPEYWEAHFNLGASWLARGRPDEARAAFETVLRLNPEFEPARRALDEIKSRRATRAP